MLQTKVLWGGVSEQSLEDRLYVMFADEDKITKIIEKAPAAHCFGGQNSSLLPLNCNTDTESFLVHCHTVNWFW